MKRFLFMSCLAGALLTSCSSDDDPVNNGGNDKSLLPKVVLELKDVQNFGSDSDSLYVTGITTFSTLNKGTKIVSNLKEQKLTTNDITSILQSEHSLGLTNPYFMDVNSKSTNKWEFSTDKDVNAFAVLCYMHTNTEKQVKVSFSYKVYNGKKIIKEEEITSEVSDMSSGIPAFQINEINY